MFGYLDNLDVSGDWTYINSGLRVVLTQLYSQRVNELNASPPPAPHAHSAASATRRTHSCATSDSCALLRRSCSRAPAARTCSPAPAP
eukprot:981345-Prymnesium_polylepis.1